jgi:hypothetical protein
MNFFLKLGRILDGPQEDMKSIRAGATGEEAELLFREEFSVEKSIHHPAVDNASQKLEVYFQERDGPRVLERHLPLRRVFRTSSRAVRVQARRTYLGKLDLRPLRNA